MASVTWEVSGRGELIARMEDARRRSDAVFSIVRPEALYERPIAERHRIIFYLGHLEAFDWNMLRGIFAGVKGFDPALDRLFAFGIDPVDGGLPSDTPADWPTEEKVREYVGTVRRVLDEKLAGGAGTGRDGFGIETLLNVAIEHRLMHVETLAYMFHQLPLDRKVAVRSAVDRGAKWATVPTAEMIAIPSGVATLGLSRSRGTFGWDNEFEKHSVEVAAFEIDRYKVTNRQYLEFIKVGGYDSRGFWSDEDWAWKNKEGVSHPVFWNRADSSHASKSAEGGALSSHESEGWFFRAMFEEVPLPLDWPVYVSHAEASAFARWSGKALPTEEEWHRAAYGAQDGREGAYPWGNERPERDRGNFDFANWNPTPVNAHPRGRSAWGVEDMLGNGWEWTSTKFAAFSGFEPFPFYRGYSADFFDGKHFVMKGGSARTPACMLRASFRNWFQPHYQYVYAGFRCVRR